MINDDKLLKNYMKTHSEISVAKQEESMSAEGYGKIEGDECTLKKVLYVPELTENLLSVNSITNNGGTVLFTEDKVIISKEKDIVLMGQNVIMACIQWI
jgi:hypothetical protein